MSNKKSAIYAGTFDPFTNGHLNIVQRGLEIFDNITVLIAVSPTKKPLLTVEERTAMLEELFKGQNRINVDSWNGLLVDYARANNINSILRGLRPSGDFEIEFQMASMNGQLNPDVETVFLMTSSKYYYISSSLVKEVYNHGGDVRPFVPESIFKQLKPNN